MKYKDFNKIKETPNRTEQIIELLKKKPMCNKELMEALGLTQPRVSELIAKLKVTGVITTKKVQTRIYYALTEKVK